MCGPRARVRVRARCAAVIAGRRSMTVARGSPSVASPGRGTVQVVLEAGPRVMCPEHGPTVAAAVGSSLRGSHHRVRRAGRLASHTVLQERGHRHLTVVRRTDPRSAPRSHTGRALGYRRPRRGPPPSLERGPRRGEPTPRRSSQRAREGVEACPVRLVVEPGQPHRPAAGQAGPCRQDRSAAAPGLPAQGRPAAGLPAALRRGSRGWSPSGTGPVEPPLIPGSPDASVDHSGLGGRGGGRRG